MFLHKWSCMKLIVAVVQDYDTDRLLRTTTAAGFRVTRIGSDGGFLRTSSSTLIFGVEEERVPECIQLIRQTCGTREQAYEMDDDDPWIDPDIGEISTVALGGGVALILPVSRFAQFQTTGANAQAAGLPTPR